MASAFSEEFAGLWLFLFEPLLSLCVACVRIWRQEVLLRAVCYISSYAGLVFSSRRTGANSIVLSDAAQHPLRL